MKPLFEFQDWKATNVPDFDHPATATLAELAYGPSGICPEPSCLERSQDETRLEYSGPIIFEGADGEPTGVARPCPEHLDFQYADGWYMRFSEAVMKQSGQENETRQCRQCGEEFTEWLWGWGGLNCAGCSYQKATGQLPPGDRVMALA